MHMLMIFLYCCEYQHTVSLPSNRHCIARGDRLVIIEYRFLLPTRKIVVADCAKSSEHACMT